MQATVPFGITKMDATIPEGIDFVWNGRAINSGPLQVQLDNQARAEGDNRGELDYGTNVARARFNLRIDLSGVAKLLARAASRSSSRSEEHTSELQSRFELVCRLLREKIHSTPTARSRSMRIRVTRARST